MKSMADVYARRIYNRSAKDLGQAFIDAYEDYMEKANLGEKSAKVSFEKRDGTVLGKPLFKLPEQRGNCYITSAVCGALGLPDDCVELRTLRAFRDGVISASTEDRRETKAYQQTAPALVARIEARRDAASIHRTMRVEYLAPAIACLHRGDAIGAHLRYRELVRFAARAVGHAAVGLGPGEGSGGRARAAPRRRSAAHIRRGEGGGPVDGHEQMNLPGTDRDVYPK